MEKFNSLNEAMKAAQSFFSENFGYNNGVGIESANGNQVEFYSKNDPGMVDTYTCIVDDGKSRKCKNGGQVITEDNE